MPLANMATASHNPPSDEESDQDSDDPQAGLSAAQKAVLQAIKKIKDYQAALKFNFTNELETLLDAVGELPPRVLPDQKTGPIWVCDAERLSMDEWHKSSPYDNMFADPPLYPGAFRRPFPRPPLPMNPMSISQPKYVLKAFYRNVPDTVIDAASVNTADDFKRLHTNSVGRSVERPQRIQVSSDVLLHELGEISGLSSQDSPFVMIPPFKLLVHNWSKIESTLSDLDGELQALDAAEDEKNRGEDGREVASGAPALKSPGKIEQIEDVQRQRLQERRDHLKCLYDFIKTDLGYLIGLRMKIKDRSLEKVSFDEVYHIFSPGDLIVSERLASRQLYQVYSVTGGRVRLSKSSNGDHMDDDMHYMTAGVGTWTSVRLETYIMASDGKKVGPRQISHGIKHFNGERKITDLEAVPIEFLGAEAAASICARLRERGRKFLSCIGHKKYDGMTVDPLDMSGDNASAWQSPMAPTFSRPRRMMSRTERVSFDEELQSDVYIDIFSYYHYHLKTSPVLNRLKMGTFNIRETSEPGSGRLNKDYLNDHDVDEALTTEFMMANRDLLRLAAADDPELRAEAVQLLPYQLPAYEFRSRQWVWIDVENVEEIDKSEGARKSGWNDLVIPDSYSQLLVSLVDNHTSGADMTSRKLAATRSSPNVQIDLVRGKGRGLIILLHGPPGSGKTSTAETIAAYTGRPLYAITCGDIGVTADDVEFRLQYHTELAARWGCVLLLDEADVFLMKRSWRDMHRNALVSVFLRHLEYYSGILFLTTNIVGVIDEAFKSRIHVALRYPTIDLPSTEKIWNSLLNRLAKDNETSAVKIQFDRSTLLKFARDHYRKHEASDTTWNGRQVRNAFQTAIALGEFERLSRIKDEGLTPDEALRLHASAATAGGGGGHDKATKRLTTIRLTRRNLEDIAKTARDFEDYIVSIRGPDREVAQASQLRDDDYGRQLPRAQKNYDLGSKDATVSPMRAAGRRDREQHLREPAQGSGRGASARASPAGRAPPPPSVASARSSGKGKEAPAAAARRPRYRDEYEDDDEGADEDERERGHDGKGWAQEEGDYDDDNDNDNDDSVDSELDGDY
ncbi:hypothetical protein B0T24DRAFT_217163 [Lasiosphaeria ovina]|uniref:AAA+ ATPase domain-containing protein n=1 Tax=Lasiosphaeria ovina TaxID=92902 RepID=A0AAE0KHE4_9PEZI|nr:hypothetical protein B0T24DRAFT_217163 [Lasiosphaeria ovina]